MFDAAISPLIAEVAGWFSRPVPGRDPEPAPTDRARLCIHAKRLLDDPVLTLAFERIERDLVATWRKTAVGESEAREAAYRLLWALESVRGKLLAMLGDGKMIEAEQKLKDAAAAAADFRRARA